MDTVPSDEQDPYTLLGVTRESSVAEIRERYRALVKTWHPDRHQSSPANVREEVTRRMQRINAAYQHLTAAHERDARERRTREREARDRATRERAAQERAAQERQTREREARDRAARERQTRERQNSERQRKERQDPERQRKERQDREHETREREHPRARWVHPSRIGTGKQAPSWNRTSTVHPIAIVLRSGEKGYTIRAYLDDQRVDAAFVGTREHLLLFRSSASMHRYATRAEAHELADIPGWDSLVDRMGAAEPDAEHSYEFDLIQRSLRFRPAQWVPELFIHTREVIGEIAKAFSLDDVLNLLTVGSPFDELDDMFRTIDRPIAGWRARRRLASLQGAQASALWRLAIRGVEEHVRWLR